MYKKILLAVDGSEHSLRATKEAIKIATLAKGCQIEAVLVADFAKAKSEVLHAQGREQLEFKRRQRLAPIEEQLKNSNVGYEIKILHGEPAPTIIDYANKENFDLAIIGSRGLNSLQEMVLGSVSHKVVKRVNCPVMIIK